MVECRDIHLEIKSLENRENFNKVYFMDLLYILEMNNPLFLILSLQIVHSNRVYHSQFYSSKELALPLYALKPYFFTLIYILSIWTLYHCAYFLVHSLAVPSYLALSVLYMFAISGTKGSSGFGSVSNEDILKSTKNNNFILKTFAYC